MKKKSIVKKGMHSMLASANIIIILMMLITGYAHFINPASHNYLSLLGFAFPAFLLADLVLVVVWLFIRWEYVFLPVAGLLLAYFPAQTYTPVNVFRDAPPSAIKVLSYNVLGFNAAEAPEGQPNPILEYLELSNSDIICLQEYHHIAGNDSLWNLIEKSYPYQDTLRSETGTTLALLSRFPIRGKEHIDIPAHNNLAGAFRVDMRGEEVIVVNVHLQSVGFSNEDKAQFAEMVHGKMKRDSVKTQSKLLISKLAESAAVRAVQADSVNAFIERHKDKRIILCGDFNDHPLSYVHHTIAQNLNDCYVASGHFTGYTMSYNSMYVRIDNIMCSDHWNAYNCSVDKSITLSDHYPISCYLDAKKREE